MKKLREIVEATKSLHPMALHVKPTMVNGQQKYKVHAVGKDLADGIKHGEHLSDSELDDAHEMGAKIKHVKESVDEAMSHQAKTTMKHIPNASPALKKAAKDIKPGIAGYRDRIAMLKAGGVKEDKSYGPEADKNITVQLKKAMDMMEHGEKPGSFVEFADGEKHFVEGFVAHQILEAMEQMKPDLRSRAQSAVFQSFNHLMAAHQLLGK